VYLPQHFREDDPAEIRAFIAASRLITLVSTGPNGLRASHVPMLLDPDPAPFGTLRFHLARANAQWHDLAAGAEAMAIAIGPEAYVSPSAYATKREHGKVVPTWNYVAVHAYGVAAVTEDPTVLHELVRRLTDAHEERRADPWRVSDAPEPYVAGQLRAIVGVALPIARVDAKWKMSQNRSEADVLGVVASLHASPVAGERAAGDVVAERLRRRRFDA
jgi:transcriptional regulator